MNRKIPCCSYPRHFPPKIWGVLIQDSIQTHFKGRAESLADVVEAIGTFVQGRRGNYLVYFPSYQYLNDTLQEFQLRHPSVPVLVQRPGISESQRDAFLAAFSAEHGETLVGFAVLGGIFSEGIDLVGERLIGAVIVGVGLPQLCVERNLVRDYFQHQNAMGFEYAYTFPGMNRVLQAIGRVIRSETDCGVVVLIDARFNETRYRRLFPTWWKYLRVRHTEELREAIGCVDDMAKRRAGLGHLGRGDHEGVAETMLRPAGKVRLDGVTHDAVSEGGFIEPGSLIRVIRAQGSALVVRKRDAANENGGAS